MSYVCGVCGAKLNEGSNICPSCGTANQFAGATAQWKADPVKKKSALTPFMGFLILPMIGYLIVGLGFLTMAPGLAWVSVAFGLAAFITSIVGARARYKLNGFAIAGIIFSIGHTVAYVLLSLMVTTLFAA